MSFVETANGWVKNWNINGFNDIQVDAPDLYEKNFIPEDQNAVRVEFQGADAVTPGSGIPDPDTYTEWSPDLRIADGMRFIRFKITLDSAKDSDPTPDSPRPQVNFLRLRFRY